MKPLLLIPHPGPELRIIAWLKVYQPDVVILTQGNGSSRLSHLDQSVQLLNELGLSVRTEWLQPISDQAVYHSLLTHDPTLLMQWFKQLLPLILSNQITAIVANESEGYHPIYELCRILANQITQYLQQRNYEMLNLEFPLVKHPADPEHETAPKIEIHLTAQQLKEKIEIARSYAAQYGKHFLEEIETGFSQYGEDAFKFECLYPSQMTPYEQGELPSIVPHFETVGQQRQEAGIYTHVICAQDLQIMTQQFITQLASFTIPEENLAQHNNY